MVNQVSLACTSCVTAVTYRVAFPVVAVRLHHALPLLEHGYNHRHEFLLVLRHHGDRLAYQPAETLLARHCGLGPSRHLRLQKPWEQVD